MSAWMCSQKHLTALAVQLLTHCRGSVPATVVAELDLDGFERTRGGYARTVSRLVNLLAAENLRSLAARYPRHATNDAAVLDSFEPLTRAQEREAKAWSPLTVIKLAHCYAYQSSEHDGWEDSEACRMMAALEQKLVTMLPGYDDAPWGV